MAHRPRDYARRARRRFCAGSRKTPIELVLSGERSLEDWVEVLFQERQCKAQTRYETLRAARAVVSRDEHDA